MPRTIEVIVNPKGETTVQTKGFTGSGCQQASKALEEALGIRAAEKLTGEFYQRQEVEQPQRAHS